MVKCMEEGRKFDQMVPFDTMVSGQEVNQYDLRRILDEDDSNKLIVTNPVDLSDEAFYFV